ncbi:MAG TPA: putative metal-dependent hydrolase [Candidatus Krumholzibacteria bacterium]|nr:putative metal-dependent hydrolase [Candidatus Krumholzibacteria bacterium]
MDDLRYPIGQFDFKQAVTMDRVRGAIDEIAACPAALRSAIRGFDDAKLDTPYRDGGWTVRQVVHHVPDSHMNAYIRLKLGLTEDNPTIKPYEQQLWAQLPDAREPIGPSLANLDAVHERWVSLLRQLEEKDFSRTIFHPENGSMTLGLLTLHYAWHGKHHVAHLTSLRKRMGW